MPYSIMEHIGDRELKFNSVNSAENAKWSIEILIIDFNVEFTVQINFFER